MVDGTQVSEPGDTGTDWRLHYAIDFPSLGCDDVIVPPINEGETLKRFAIQPGD